MSNQVFQSMSAAKMASLIASAKRRIAIVAPAIQQNVADAILLAAGRIPGDVISIIVDCDEQVCRLGYGEISALVSLLNRGINVRQCAGLRIGVLVCDDRA